MPNLKENNKYLSKVIFTIELCNGVDLSENCGKDSDFYKNLSQEFPQFLIEKDCIMYQFFDKKCVKIKDSSVSLYYSGEFFNHNNFYYDVRLISHALYLYRIKHIAALRLRYINEIKPNGVKLKEIINPEFGNYNFLPYKSDIVRSLTRTEYNFEDYNLILQYGQFNLNYPSKIIKDDFILDYEAVSNNWESLSELEYTFNDLNKIIGDFYEKHLNLIVSG